MKFLAEADFEGQLWLEGKCLGRFPGPISFECLSPFDLELKPRNGCCVMIGFGLSPNLSSKSPLVRIREFPEGCTLFFSLPSLPQMPPFMLERQTFGGEHEASLLFDGRYFLRAESAGYIHTLALPANVSGPELFTFGACAYARAPLQDGVYAAVIGFTDDYHTLAEGRFESCTAGDKTLTLTRRLPDQLGHLLTLEVDQRAGVSRSIKPSRLKKVDLLPARLLPFFFLECLACGDDENASACCLPHLDPPAVRAFLGGFDEILQNPFGPGLFVADSQISGPATRVEFEFSGGKISNLFTET